MDDKAVIPEGCVVAPCQMVDVSIAGDTRTPAHVDAVTVGHASDVNYTVSWNSFTHANRMQLVASSLQFYGKPRLLRISEEKTEP